MTAWTSLASVAILVGIAVPAAAAGAAEIASPSTEPVFVPGLYRVETRNSRSQHRGIVGTRCLRSADADAFRREALAAFLTQPQFRAVCRLSEPKAVPDGFAAAMDCGAARSIISYHLARGRVALTTRTSMPDRPENASSELTLMRRVGDCPGEPSGPDP